MVLELEIIYRIFYDFVGKLSEVVNLKQQLNNFRSG
jgi:hypothetical protein